LVLRPAFDEDARSRLREALSSFLFLRRIGSAPNGAGGRLRLCVLHQPDAGHDHGEDDHPGYKEPRGHV